MSTNEYEKTKSVNIATTRSAFRTNRLLFIDRSFWVTLICNSTASICFSKNLTVLNNMHFRWRVAVWRPSFLHRRGGMVIIGRESAALIESSLLSAALVPGRALHPMGGDAHDRFH